MYFSCQLEEDIQDTPSAASDSEKIKMLENMPKERDETIARMQHRPQIDRFGVERLSKDNSLNLFYNAFMSYSMFTTVFEYIKLAATSMKSHYYKMSTNYNPNLSGRQRNMLRIDEFSCFCVALNVVSWQRISPFDLTVTFQLSAERSLLGQISCILFMAVSIFGPVVIIYKKKKCQIVL